MTDQVDPPQLDLEQLALTRCWPLSGWRLWLDRNWQLVKRFPARQVAARIWRLTRSRLGLRYHPRQHPEGWDVRDNPGFRALFDALAMARQRHPKPSRRDPLRRGQVSLLNETWSLGQPLDWATRMQPRPSHLWRFQLHYHEFLLDLVGHSQADDWPLVWSTIEHWIETNKVSDRRTADDAWHPYCISRRLPVWFQLLSVADSSLSGDLRHRIESSALVQADYLYHNLETDLRGNHLLENLHALALTCCYFDGPQVQSWRRKVRIELLRELDAQVLPSGEHFELSPMYHCVVTANLLQLAIVAERVDSELTGRIRPVVESMLRFLEFLNCPDGEIPLLSDSCFGEAPEGDAIRRLADAAGMSLIDSPALSDRSIAEQRGGYWCHRRQQDQLLFDAGPVAAAHLPAHGHADLLNVTGSINGTRIMVDSGNGSYDLDATRTYCRSSVAHNVMTIDDQDHADVWSRFRMGFAGRVGQLQRGSQHGFHWARNHHDAYRRIGVPRVTRWVASHGELLFWICLDQVEAHSPDHQFRGFAHFSPGLRLTPTNVGQEPVFQVDGGPRPLRIGFLGTLSVESASSWLYPEFGKKIRKPALAYSGSPTHSSMLGWYVCADPEASVRLDADSRSPTIHVQLPGQSTPTTLEV